MIAWVCGVLAGVFLTLLAGLVNDEIRGWLNVIPRALLRLAARRLDSSQRVTIYEEEWLPELEYKLRDAGSRPITRLLIGIWFSADMIRGSSRVARLLQRRPAENTVVHAQVAEGRGGVALPKLGLSGSVTVSSSAAATLHASATLTADGTVTQAEADHVIRRTIEQMGTDTRARTGVRPIVPPTSERPGGGTAI